VGLRESLDAVQRKRTSLHADTGSQCSRELKNTVREECKISRKQKSKFSIGKPLRKFCPFLNLNINFPEIPFNVLLPYNGKTCLNMKTSDAAL
jgi:hypothetical protein